MSSVVLQAKEVTFFRGDKAFLSGVNVSVRAGEILAIGGTNGAGKTTLLRVLSGELTPAKGEVLWKGKPLRSFSDREMALHRAYLSQSTSVALPFRSIEIVLLGAEAAGLSGNEAWDLAWKSMAQSGVEHLADRIITTLSGGEAQRVHWARVLAQLGGDYQGKCLILDEPVSSLDIAHQHEMLALAKEVAEAGAAVVTVLHDLNLTAEFADRLLLLGEGRVICEGTPSETLTAETIRAVFGIEARVIENPVTGGPLVVVEKSGLSFNAQARKSLREIISSGAPSNA